MPPKITLSGDDEEKFRRLWAAGEPVSRICISFGLSHDAANIVRKRLGLPARTARTRAARRAPISDPTPEEIEAACAELRAKHLAKRLAESPSRRYREDNEYGGRIYPCDVFDVDE